MSVAPGMFYVYLMAPYNGHVVLWDIPVVLKAGANSALLSTANIVTVK